MDDGDFEPDDEDDDSDVNGEDEGTKARTLADYFVYGIFILLAVGIIQQCNARQDVRTDVTSNRTSSPSSFGCARDDYDCIDAQIDAEMDAEMYRDDPPEPEDYGP